MTITISLFILAYLFGSVCSAIIVCKLFNLPDPRSTGSNNPGATNVLRIAGKSKAAIVLVGDMLKGYFPVLIAQLCGMTEPVVGMIGLFAVIGHMFPIFYQGKGGKGVATAIGVYFGLSPWLGLLALASWLILFKLFRYSSLASLVMVILAPIYATFLLGYIAWVPVLIIGGLVCIKHAKNIERLLNGTESKFKKD